MFISEQNQPLLLEVISNLITRSTTMKATRKTKDVLNSCIEKICQTKENYCVNPKTDFTRNKKLPMDKVIKTILSFSSKSLNNEMIDIWGHDTNDIASVSAFVQQRSKIKPSAFEDIFKTFANEIPIANLYQGYRLLAVDGSDLLTPINREDTDSLFQSNDNSPYNLFHLNALFDLNSKYILMLSFKNAKRRTSTKLFVLWLTDTTAIFLQFSLLTEAMNHTIILRIFSKSDNSF